MRRRRLVIACSLFVFACPCACGDSGSRCEQAFEAKDWSRSAEACAKAFEATGDLGAAGRLSWAEYQQGNGQKAMDRLQALGDRAGTGRIHLAAGRTLQDRKETDQARGHLERALELLEAAGDHWGASRAAQALFRIHQSAAAYRLSLEYARRSQLEAAAAGDAEQEAVGWMAVFSALYEVGDIDGADRALHGAARLTAPGDMKGTAYLNIKQALLHRARGRNPLAAALYERAYQAAQAAGLPDVAWSAQFNLVEVAIDEGRPAEAAGHLELAMQALGKVPRIAATSRMALHYEQARIDRALGRLPQAVAELDQAMSQPAASEWTWRLETERGVLAEMSGDTAAARGAFVRAIEAIEELRARLGADDLKAWVIEAKREPYRRLFTLQARQGEGVAALVTTERMQARTLLDAIARGGCGPGRSVECAEALLHGAGSTAPRVASAVSPQALLSAARGEWILSYFEAQDGWWLLVTADGQVRLFKLEEPKPALAAQIDALLQTPADAARSESLARVLFPSGSLPPDGRRLTVIPGGPLRRVPFAALRSGDRFVVERWPVRYIPSISASAPNPAPRPRPAGIAVSLADPGGDLPGARAEGMAVARALGVPAVLGAEATADQLRRAAAAAVLHLAAHGGVGPEAAWLQLADRPVTASEVMEWGMAPDLVVLSSCASHATQATELWGSMSSAFLSGGTRTVVATLRPIQDGAAVALMEHFFQGGVPRDPVGALADAQRSAIKDGAPLEGWTQFVVLGG